MTLTWSARSRTKNAGKRRLKLYKLTDVSSLCTSVQYVGKCFSTFAIVNSIYARFDPFYARLCNEMFTFLYLIIVLFAHQCFEFRIIYGSRETYQPTFTYVQNIHKFPTFSQDSRFMYLHIMSVSELTSSQATIWKGGLDMNKSYTSEKWIQVLIAACLHRLVHKTCFLSRDSGGTKLLRSFAVPFLSDPLPKNPEVQPTFQ